MLKALNWRYATKKFDPKRKVSEADLSVLMESLRLAPSSMGLQPWKFMLVRDPAARKRLCAACFGQKQVVDASHLIAICAMKEITPAYLSRFMGAMASANPVESTAGKIVQAAKLAGYRKMIEGNAFSMGKEKTAVWNKKQAYIALGFLLFACAQLGIDSCPIEGYGKEQAEKALGLDKMGLEIATVVPVGYRAKDDTHAKESKVRFSKEEVVLEI